MNETASGLRVKCIDHVTLIVKDLERSRQFYVDVLGMQDVERPGFSFRGKWFQAGSTQIHLILEHEESGPAGFALSHDKPTTRNHHLAFEVDDSHQAAQHVAESGVEVLWGPKRRPDGAIQTFIADPDGHIVELCSPPAN